MNRRMWIGALVVLALLITTILAVNWAIGRYLSPEGVSAQLSTALEREVRVEEVGFSLWSGIRLNDLVISEHPDLDSGTWLTADSLVLKPEWWPLLFGKFEITHVQVVRPHTTVYRTAEGEWNLFRGVPPPEDPVPDPDPSLEPDPTPIQLRIDRVQLVDGTVDFRDDEFGIAERFAYDEIVLNDFDLRTGGELDLRDVQFPGGGLTGTVTVQTDPVQALVRSMQLRVERPEELSLALGSLLPEATGLSRGTVHLDVTGGRLGAEKFEISFRGNGANNRLNAGTDRVLSWNRIEWEGQLEGELSEGIFNLELSNVRVDGGQYETSPMFEFTGTLPEVVASRDPARGESPWSLRGDLGEFRVRNDLMDQDVSIRSGRLSVDHERVQASRVTGTLTGADFEAGAEFTLPFDLDNPFQGQLSLEPLQLRSLLRLVPHDLLPDPGDVEGRVSTRDLRFHGSLAEPFLEGTVRVEGFGFRPRVLASPLTLPQGDLVFRDERINLSGLAVQFREHRFDVSGTVRQHEPRTLSLRTEFEGIPVNTFLAGLSNPPELSENWRPSGVLSGTVRISGEPAAPVIDGTLSTPEFSVGPIRGEQGEVSLLYESANLEVRSLNLNAYGGEFQGRASIHSLFDQPGVSSSFRFDRAHLGTLLQGLTGQGGSSTGDINVEGTLSGPMGNLDEMEGSLRATGESLQLRDIPALNSIDDALVFGISGALGEDLGPVVGRVLTRTLPEQTEELRRVFEPSTLSDFDRLDVDLRLSDGTATIQTGLLENPEVTMNLGGTVLLDGRLDANVRVQARDPLVQKTTQSWLRNLLQAGLPPVAVRGTVMEPEYNTRELRRATIETLVRMAVIRQFNSDEPEQNTPADQLRRRLLDSLLN